LIVVQIANISASASSVVNVTPSCARRNAFYSVSAVSGADRGGSCRKGDQRFWAKFTTDGREESMCGWLKDKYGLSWQIIPKQLGELMGSPDPEKSQRVVQAMLKMKKIIIADLQKGI
jgi:hypothetical protein